MRCGLRKNTTKVNITRRDREREERFVIFATHNPIGWRAAAGQDGEWDDPDINCVYSCIALVTSEGPEMVLIIIWWCYTDFGQDQDLVSLQTQEIEKRVAKGHYWPYAVSICSEFRSLSCFPRNRVFNREKNVRSPKPRPSSACSSHKWVVPAGKGVTGRRGVEWLRLSLGAQFGAN